jgi:hypothetical protein
MILGISLGSKQILEKKSDRTPYFMEHAKPSPTVQFERKNLIVFLLSSYNSDECQDTTLLLFN